MNELLKAFKQLEKIDHSTEDEHITNLLQRSYDKLQRDYGAFETHNPCGQALVLCRARYEYQDLLEHFNDNYREDLVDFGISQMEVENENTIQETTYYNA